MSVPKYSSIYKAAKDLVNKPFSWDNKVEIKTNASNGAKFTLDGSIQDKDGSAASNIKVEYAFDNIKVDKLTLGTDKKIVGEFTYKGAAPNTDMTFKFQDGSRASGADITASVGAVYTDSDNALTLTADADILDGPKFDFSGVFGYQGFLVGGSASVATSLLASGDAAAKDAKDAAPVGLSNYNVLLGYRSGDYTLAAQTEDSLSKASVSLVHNASDALSTGAIAGFDVSGSSAFDITLGAQYKLDGDSTVSGAANSAGKVSLNYKQKVSDFATFSASGQVDPLALDSDNHKFGLTLTLGN